HRDAPGPTADLGSGPGRFTDTLGDERAAKVLLDLSSVALHQARTRPSDGRRAIAPRHYVVGDAGAPPLRPGRFGTVALLGNVLGFSEARWERVLESAARLTAPGGILLLEAVAGPGEHSRYLQRLPRGAAARALRAPPAWVDARIEREGFEAMVPRKAEDAGAFRRAPPETITERLTAWGLDPLEVLAVAPVMGTDPERIEVVRADAKAWSGLLALEERWGARPERWAAAAAYLVAARRPASGAPRRPMTPATSAPRTPRVASRTTLRLVRRPPVRRRALRRPGIEKPTLK
ncbi:MAG TPA: class I SAM-dependent methyltransferase, partial [Thermoplasmata archaeon]|nr:class I SAM-dependent methyltransferase [Thermoplasmata archaeon]